MAELTVSLSPFDRGPWSGEIRLHGDVSDDINFTEDDIAEVIAQGESNPEDWDGEVAAVVKLKDGRYVAWESWWGPTGNGFSEDAYGGDSDITITDTLDAAIRYGMTDKGRRLCGLEQPTSEIGR